MTEQQLDKIKGLFYGQAIGDALGLGTEFLQKQEINQFYPHGLSDYSQIIQDKHRSRWAKGDWTDDTDQFLCICDSITRENKVDELLFARELHAWFHDNPMGVGQTVYKVLSLPQFTKFPHRAAKLIWELSKRENASNGAIMRTSILGAFRFWDYQSVAESTERIAKVTHWDSRCVGSCVVLTLLVAHILNESKLLDSEQLCGIADQYDDRIKTFIQLAEAPSIVHLKLDERSMIGYTLKAMSAGLWAYFNATSFEEGLQKVVHEGGDADTNACVAGSLLGVKFGYSAIPQRYIDGLTKKVLLDQKLRSFLESLAKAASDDGRPEYRNTPNGS